MLLLFGIAITGLIGQQNVIAAFVFGLGWLFLDVVLASAIRMAAQWEKAVVFRLGKFHSIKGPGLFLIVPLIDQLRMVNTRVLAVSIPKQQVITRDNVPVTIDGVLFFRVANAGRRDHHGAGLSLRRLAICPDLASRRHRPVDAGSTPDRAGRDRQVDRAPCREGHQGLGPGGHRAADPGHRHARGTQEDDVAQASAEREKRATITKAEGDKEASVNLALAARTMAESPARCSSARCRRSTAWDRPPPIPW